MDEQGFFSKYPQIEFRFGDLLFKPDDKLINGYFLVTGEVRQYFLDKNGVEITIAVFKPGSFIPFLYFLSSKEAKSNYYFQAQTLIKAKRAPFKDMVDFLEKNPQVAMKYLKKFAQAVTGLVVRVEEGHLGLSDRVMSLLKYLANKHDPSNGPKSILVSHKDLALWLGSSREAVTRTLSKIARKGLIGRSGRKLVVFDHEDRD